MIALAVVVAYNLELAGRRKQALHTVSEGNPEEAVVPIVVHMEAVGVVRMAVEVAHMEVAEVAVPIVVRMEAAGVVQAVRMAVEVAHKDMEAAAPNLAAEAGLDHKTSIIPSCQICNHF